MSLRRAIRIYAGLPPEPLSFNQARAATDRIERLLQYHEWGRCELRLLIEREARRFRA